MIHVQNKWKIRLQLTKPVTWPPLIWGVVCGAAASGTHLDSVKILHFEISKFLIFLQLVIYEIMHVTLQVYYKL